MRVAKLILHYQRNDLTDQVLRTFPDAIVVDNGSADPFEKAGIRLATNLGYTRGFVAALKQVLDDYDAVALLNNDIVAEPTTFDALSRSLELNPRLGIIAASCNSPHSQMPKQPGMGLRLVPFVEFVAPLIRTEVFHRIGMLDERFSLGWGVEVDFCWRARGAGYFVAVSDAVSIRHLQHQTIESTTGYPAYKARAEREMLVGFERQIWNELGIAPAGRREANCFIDGPNRGCSQGVRAAG